MNPENGVLQRTFRSKPPSQESFRAHAERGIRLMVLLQIAWSASTSWALTIDNLSPLSGTAGISTPPEMQVWVQGVQAKGATVKFYRRVPPPTVRPEFSVVVLPDTQRYSGSLDGGTPAIFNSQADWIVANRESKNIVFVIHLGDIVQNGETQEWLAATNAMTRLENPVTTKLPYGIPYSMAAGNHDGLPYFTTYNQYFGSSRFAGRPSYGGHFGTTNNNHYSLFSAAGLDFIVISLEFSAGSNPAIMTWANSVLRANVNRRAIVVSHSLIKANAQWVSDWTPEGQVIYDAIKENPNLFLMLCGHIPPFGSRKDVYNGISVATLLSDYENLTPNGGNGYLRIMKFVPSTNQIQVKTYSPWLDESRTTIHDDFALDYNMVIPDVPYQLVATINKASSGIVSGGEWADLAAATSYQWYATAEEAGVVTRSSTWGFSTSSADSWNSGLPMLAAPNPLRILNFVKPRGASPVLTWSTIGGHRYRVEYCNGGPGNTGMNFIEIIRSQAEETDPAMSGSASYQTFVDDGSLTGGLKQSRFYRVREIP